MASCRLTSAAHGRGARFGVGGAAVGRREERRWEAVGSWGSWDFKAQHVKIRRNMEKHGGKIDRNRGKLDQIKKKTFGDDKLKLGAEKNGMWTKPYDLNEDEVEEKENRHLLDE